MATVDLDAPDILVYLIARLGPDRTMLTEASRPGMIAEGAAYALRSIADQWDPVAAQYTEMTARWVALRHSVEDVRELIAAAAFAETPPTADALAAGILAILDRPTET